MIDLAMPSSLPVEPTPDLWAWAVWPAARPRLDATPVLVSVTEESDTMIALAAQCPHPPVGSPAAIVTMHAGARQRAHPHSLERGVSAKHRDHLRRFQARIVPSKGKWRVNLFRDASQGDSGGYVARISRSASSEKA